jgi:hypothetical protein
MDQNEIPHDPRHPGVSSGASKTIISLWYVRHKLCTYLSSRLALSPNRLNRASTWASSPRSTIRCVQNEFCGYVMFGTKLCTYLAPTLTLSWNIPNEIPLDPCHLGVASSTFKMISEPVVRSAQTMHLSCVKIITISKRTEMSFHLSLTT